jgi:hypothetical protein
MIHQSLRLILIGLLFLLSNSYLAAQTNTQQGTQGAEGVQGSGMTQERAIQELQKRSGKSTFATSKPAKMQNSEID